MYQFGLVGLAQHTYSIVDDNLVLEQGYGRENNLAVACYVGQDGRLVVGHVGGEAGLNRQVELALRHQ